MQDQTTDRNLTTLHQLLQCELPELVKTASLDGVDELGCDGFADSANRQFPCNTPGNTVLSYAYFLKGASDLRSSDRAWIEHRFQKFAREWGVAEKLADTKQALVDPTGHTSVQYAYTDEVSEDEGDEQEVAKGLTQAKMREMRRKRHLLPLKNAEYVRKASEHLYQYRDRYPYEWRRTMAQNILAKQAEFRAELPAREEEYLCKAAGYGWASFRELGHALMGRAFHLPNPYRGTEEHQQMYKAAQALEICKGTPDDETLLKTALLLDGIDRRCGMCRDYTNGLKTPEEMVYGALTIKLASTIKESLVRTTSGQDYRKSDLVKAGLAPYRAVSPDLAEAVRGDFSHVDEAKVAAIVPTLPRGDAERLDCALAACGVKVASALLKDAGLTHEPQAWDAVDWTKAAGTLVR